MSKVGDCRVTMYFDYIVGKPYHTEERVIPYTHSVPSLGLITGTCYSSTLKLKCR